MDGEPKPRPSFSDRLTVGSKFLLTPFLLIIYNDLVTVKVKGVLFSQKN